MQYIKYQKIVHLQTEVFFLPEHLFLLMQMFLGQSSSPPISEQAIQIILPQSAHLNFCRFLHSANSFPFSIAVQRPSLGSLSVFVSSLVCDFFDSIVAFAFLAMLVGDEGPYT